MKIWNNGIRLI
jgi:hypothetical protein